MLLKNYAIIQNSKIKLIRFGSLQSDTIALILRIPAIPLYIAIFILPALRSTYCSITPDISHGYNHTAFNPVKMVTRESLKPQLHHLWCLSKSQKGVIS